MVFWDLNNSITVVQMDSLGIDTGHRLRLHQPVSSSTSRDLAHELATAFDVGLRAQEMSLPGENGKAPRPFGTLSLKP